MYVNILGWSGNREGNKRNTGCFLFLFLFLFFVLFCFVFVKTISNENRCYRLGLIILTTAAATMHYCYQYHHYYYYDVSTEQTQLKGIFIWRFRSCLQKNTAKSRTWVLKTVFKLDATTQTGQATLTCSTSRSRRQAWNRQTDRRTDIEQTRQGRTRQTPSRSIIPVFRPPGIRLGFVSCKYWCSRLLSVWAAASGLLLLSLFGAAIGLDALWSSNCRLEDTAGWMAFIWKLPLRARRLRS